MLPRLHVISGIGKTEGFSGLLTREASLASSLDDVVKLLAIVKAKLAIDAGAPFVWGNWLGHGFPPAPDSLQDISENSELIIMWGNDPLFHSVYTGIDTARPLKYWKELGKKIIVIDPLYNETAAFVADKWIPIRPGTDGALCCAILYQRIMDGTYCQGYLYNTTPQNSITHVKFLDCAENPPQKWNGGHLDNLNATEFWEPVEYPAPGCNEVHLLWQRGSSNNNTPHRSRDLKAYRNPIDSRLFGVRVAFRP